MPYGYKRSYFDKTLKERGFVSDDYDVFEVGTVPSTNPKFFNYLIFPIKEDGDNVGIKIVNILSLDIRTAPKKKQMTSST